MPSPLPVVTLRTARTSDHPWIYLKMLQKADPRARPGDRVAVVDRTGAGVGQGFFNPRSQIAVRLLTDRAGPALDDAWLAERLAGAARLRREVLRLEEVTDAYRVVHAEGDGLSGLVVDRLGNLLVLELFSLGWSRWLPALGNALETLFPGLNVHARLDRRSAELEGMPPLHAGRAAVTGEVREHGLRFKVDASEGHKTGFFCDQRDNRRRFRELARGHTVLDAFCYSGGFAVSAAAGGAASVTAVDLDEKALELAKANAALNHAKVDFQHADVFNFLRAETAAGRRYGAIVLDPSKFARGPSGVPAALRSYEDLNRLALGVLEPGGLLLTCSCSGAVPPEAFRDAVHRASRMAGRPLEVLEARGAGPDHPVALACPETEYLKALFCRAR